MSLYDEAPADGAAPASAPAGDGLTIPDYEDQKPSDGMAAQATAGAAKELPISPKQAKVAGAAVVVLILAYWAWPSSSTDGAGDGGDGYQIPGRQNSIGAECHEGDHCPVCHSPADYVPPPPPAPGAANPTLPVLRTTTDPDGTVHFDAATGQLTPREHDMVSLPLDYSVQFDITPGPTVVDQWSSIVHFSATGGDCCNYGDRVPAVFFYPGKRQLHIIDGHGANGGGNDECVIDEELLPAQKYTVQIDVHERHVEVFFDGFMKCTEPRKDRRPFASARVFASDPWYDPANAVIENLVLRPLPPVTGCTDNSNCNFDITATAEVLFNGPGVCEPQPYGQDCNRNPVRFDAATQEWTLVAGQQQIVRNLPLVHEARFAAHQAGQSDLPPPPPPFPPLGAVHAIIPIPMDYIVAFDITPQGAVAGWANILHFTASMGNCCEYGDRIPGIWFHPGTTKLHIRDGMDSNGNAGCDPMDPLPLNVNSHIEVSIGQNGVDVSVNNVVMCSREASARRPWAHAHVFVSDPWHAPALATIGNLVVRHMAPTQGCMVDAACNRNHRATVPDPSACVYERTGSRAYIGAPTVGSDCYQLHEITYTPAPSPCTEDATGGRCGLKIQLIPASRPTELTAFQPDVTTLAPGRTQGIHTIQNIPLDYRISFEINPHQSVESGWSNILHVTATGQNCCAYGDRLPGIWFYPGGTEPCTSYSCPGHRLHIVHGHRDSGNDDCSPPDELPYGRFTTVQVDIRQKHVEVFYDGLSKCTEPRGETETFNSAHIYVSDHWHPAARATVQNMALEQLVPVLGCTKELACDYNPRASVDDGSCTMVQPGYACGVANQIAPPDGHGPWRFITSPRQLSNTQGQQLHAMVHLPLDYTIHFDITPDNSQNPAWTSVLHFSATGANCCEYGDRVPAVYFYPGQKRFHIIDGQPSVGNDECVIEDILIPGQLYHVEIQITELQVQVKINTEIKCTEPKSQRQRLNNVHVYASDPWYDPAGASIANFEMTVP